MHFYILCNRYKLCVYQHVPLVYEFNCTKKLVVFLKLFVVIGNAMSEYKFLKYEKAKADWRGVADSGKMKKASKKKNERESEKIEFLCLTWS